MSKPLRAVCYLRSSKDRHDASIDAQRRELRALATAQQITIVGEFSDAVESGKDDVRPGFQALLAQLRADDRGWNAILMLDTARLSRRRVNAIVFEEMEARRRGVRVIYKSIPDADPVTEMLLKAVLQAMDEWHSMTSKAKGLAGMRENVYKGFRAGGRAPMGYVLERVATGAVRDGMPVTKSRLVPGPDAERVRAYLKARAAGKPRAELRGVLDKPATSLIGIERNAVTYAGHTVWNRHAEAHPGGYVGGAKYRPAEEWVVQRDTHQPLISEAEARAILAALQARSTGRQRRSDYLLTGMLTTPAGKAWWGNAGYYRHGKRNVSTARIDRAIVAQVAKDMRSPQFVAALVSQARKAQAPKDRAREAADLRKQIHALEIKIARLSNLVPEMTQPRPLLAKMDELEAERTAKATTLADLQLRLETERALSQITDAHVEAMLAVAIEQMEDLGPAELKDALRRLIERVELDPTSLTCRIRYRIRLGGGVKLASPRERALNPTVAVTRAVALT